MEMEAMSMEIKQEYDSELEHLFKTQLSLREQNSTPLDSPDRREAMMRKLLDNPDRREAMIRKLREIILNRNQHMLLTDQFQEKPTYANERRRIEHLNELYKQLRALIPNPTMCDRASIVGDAINYIRELRITIGSLKSMVDEKRCARERRKLRKTEDETILADAYQRKSNETEVSVHVFNDEVTVKLILQKNMNCTLFVSKILEDVQLDLFFMETIKTGGYYNFLFKTKMREGSPVQASLISKKLIEAMDTLPAASAFGSF